MVSLIHSFILIRILLSNRDEFFERPSLVCHRWTENPFILAGKDLKKSDQGTWLGIHTRSGHLAVITNVREEFGSSLTSPTNLLHKPLEFISRGKLVRDFLTDETISIDTYLNQVSTTNINNYYQGFNLLLGDLRHDEFKYASNRPSWNCLELISPNIHVMSNDPFHSDMSTKTSHARELFLQLLTRSVRVLGRLPGDDFDSEGSRILFI
jgi:uncharacterized protein with NRDE domain